MISGRGKQSRKQDKEDERRRNAIEKATEKEAQKAKATATQHHKIIHDVIAQMETTMTSPGSNLVPDPLKMAVRECIEKLSVIRKACGSICEDLPVDEDFVMPSAVELKKQLTVCKKLDACLSQTIKSYVVQARMGLQ